MTFASSTPEIDAMLARLLGPVLGHVPAPWPATVYRALDRLARGEGTDSETWLRRKMATRDSIAIDVLVGEATVPHTAFYRHAEQLEHLQTAVLPALARRRRREALRVWSAGCATGEEAYTLALVARDAGVAIDLLATDVSEAALAVARTGTYSGRRVRDLPQARGAPTWTAPEALRRSMRFHRASLVGPDPSLGWSSIDVIFCRNVLIYFDTDGAHRVFSTLRRLLADDGWLVVAPVEAVVHPEGVYADSVAPLGFFRRRPVSRPHIPAARPLLESRPPTPPAPSVIPPPPSRLEQGARLLGVGDLVGAESVITSLLNDSPDHAPAWFLLGELLLQRGERTQARTAFTRSARCAPTDPGDMDPETLAAAATRRAEMC